MRFNSVIFTAAFFVVSATDHIHAETIQVAAPNLRNIEVVQQISQRFSQETSIDVEWTILESHDRAFVTQLVNGGFDVVFLDVSEVPLLAAQEVITPLEQFADVIDADAILPSLIPDLSNGSQLFAAPFQVWPSVLIYRADVFGELGYDMPEDPTWDFLVEAAESIAESGTLDHGICLNGRPGQYQNMTIINSIAHSFGARWYDENWNVEFESDAWEQALEYYVWILRNSGSPDAVENGYYENLSLFRQGRCAAWIEGAFAIEQLLDTEYSSIADSIGVALLPRNEDGLRGGSLYGSALAIPSSSDAAENAADFISWLTQPSFMDEIASDVGWANVAHNGRRTSFNSAEYINNNPYAAEVGLGLAEAGSCNRTNDAIPYIGNQFVAIPHYPALAEQIGIEFARALAGEISVTEALSNAQDIAGVDDPCPEDEQCPDPVSQICR